VPQADEDSHYWRQISTQLHEIGLLPGMTDIVT